LALAFAAAAGDGLRATRLCCEDQPQPLAVDAARPRLSWILEADGRARSQRAFRVLVASSATLLERDQGDLWDSGTVTSAEQNQVEYDGRALASNQECFWKIQATDQDGVVGPWSGAARWSMGILRPEDWQARWIGATADTNGLPLFRREFAVVQPLRRAVVHVCGLGHHELVLDGRKVGDQFLDPPWSVFERTAFYASYDVTSLLAPGRHVFGVLLGKGFYNTAGDRRVHGVQTNRPLKLILQAHLWYADGTERTVVSDADWRTAPGPITHSAILGGEDHDARRWPEGWDRPRFDDASWQPAVQTHGPGGVLRAAFSPPLKAHDSFAPVRIDEPAPGVFVYDFAQNASAIPRLAVRGAAGQAVKLVPAEQRHQMTSRRNDGRGLVNQAGVGRPNFFQYTLRGGAPEEWTPRFVYSGFQYLQLEGAVPRGRPNPKRLPVVEDLVSLHVRNDAPTAGRFACSDPLFNRVDRIIDWAVRANLSHVLTDCPHREKLGWLEVSYLMGPSIAGRYDIARFYRKIALDCADSQEPSGLVPTVAPAYPRFDGGFAYTPEWGAAAVVIPSLLQTWYGDRQALASNYATMTRFVDFMRDTATDLVPRPGLGDWYDYGHGQPVGASRFTSPELSAMATFYRCARIVADAAALLDRGADAERYAKLAEAVARAFNARFFDGTAEYRNLGSPQTAHGMALALGLVPAGRESAVLHRAIEDLRQRRDQQTAGDIGHAYFLDALARHGRSDVIYDIASRTNLGSYGFIVNNGWTSMPEAWDADTGASMNHCMLGHIQEWFMGWIAGIQPDPAAPGFRHFVVAPQPVGRLTWARGSYDSIRGPIESHWTRGADRFELTLTVPANTTATVAIPASAAALLRESGRPLERAPGVSNVRRRPDVAVLDVGSGTYRFAVRSGARRR
jgi:hypothetical protein